MATENVQMVHRGTLEGHGGWVTQIATNPIYPEMLLSASRDKTLIMWKLGNTEDQYGVPARRLKGHSHFVSDVVISSCGQFAVSSSWDKTLRLWDLERGTTTTRFVGHKADVLSVAFSADNRQIISASRDKTIKLWNTLGELKWTQEGKSSHSEWVSTVRFSPTTTNPVIVSGGWDKKVKVWHLANFNLKSDFIGHTGYINSVTVSPDGSLPLPVAKMDKQNYGISANPSTTHFTPWKAVTRSTPSVFHQIAIGSALHVEVQLKSGIWNKNSWSTSSRFKQLKAQMHPSVYHYRGRLTAKLCSQDTPTTLSAFGSSLQQLVDTRPDRTRSMTFNKIKHNPT